MEQKKIKRLTYYEILEDAQLVASRLGEKTTTNVECRLGLIPANVYSSATTTIKYNEYWLEISVQPYGVVFEGNPVKMHFSLRPHRCNYGDWVDDLHGLASKIRDADEAEVQTRFADLPGWRLE